MSGGLLRDKHVDAVVLLLPDDYDQSQEEFVVGPDGRELEIGHLVHIQLILHTDSD